MKGIHGLVVAVFLGILGAGVNMYYLRKGRDVETVEFVGIREDANIVRGKTILKEHLTPVAIPRANVGNLAQYAYLYKDVGTIVGRKSVRNYKGAAGELVMREDLRTPPPDLNLKEDEAAVWVTIDSGTTVTPQIIPGVTPVSFYLPKSRQSAVANEEWEWVGPFEVLAVGNRLGRPELMRAEHVAEQQKNVLTLRARYEDGQLEPKIAELKEYLRRTNNTPLEVLLHRPVAKRG